MLLGKKTRIEMKKESKHMKNDLEDLRKEFDAVKKTFLDTATS